MRVVGHSPVQCDAIYALEVTNGAAGASNRSVQRGTARLRPGIGATVATLTLATASHEAWTARLKVDPCGSARTYTEVRSSTR